MKETINANIGGRVFTLDRDAYDRLTIYLNDLRRRIATDTDEVMDDIEARLAEILHEGLPSQMMVVTLAMAERAIARIGKPEDFGTENQSETKNKNGMGQNYYAAHAPTALLRVSAEAWQTISTSTLHCCASWQYALYSLPECRCGYILFCGC